MPLRRKLRLVVLGATLLTLGLVMLIYVAYEWVAVNQQLREDLQARAQIIASNTEAALIFGDFAAAQETLSALSSTPDVVRACVFRQASLDAPGLFAEYLPHPSAPHCEASLTLALAKLSRGRMHAVQDVTLDGTTAGHVYLEADLRKLWQRLRIVAWGSALVTLMVALLALILSRVVENAIAKPIMQLHELMQSVAQTGDYAQRAAPGGQDEIGALIGGFNSMLGQVDQRDKDLLGAQAALEAEIKERDRANRDLSLAMQRLQDTQEQLVQSEKMASLGGLVAGVAHEINTPIGVAFTAASTLQSRSQELKTAYSSGNIKRSMLDKYVNQADEIGEMIAKNLSRAAELIQSFKQVAVDQTSSERREFHLHEYIQETLLSLRPRLKKLPYQIHVECPDNIVLDGYPGALSQILTNLVMNSVVHAFEGRDHGQIEIRALAHEHMVHLSYSDDGVGMSADARKRIFDPFFTTRRGQGGSGLGMHIVYNLVTRSLGGSIRLQPSETGVAFDIRFPCKAPTP